MELLELKKVMLEMLEVSEVEEFPKAILDILLSDASERFFERFLDKTKTDNQSDILQKVYQYYLADRTEKKQDYTPTSLSKLVAEIAKLQPSTEIEDLCAGSGALTIQNWSIGNGEKFFCKELDETVIPFLLFNLAIRNIDALVAQEDILSGKIYKKYKVEPQEKFGKVMLCER